MQEFWTADDDRPTFEETYPRYQFAPMVAMGLALGAWLHRQHREGVEDARQAQIEDQGEPGPTAPAT